MISGARFRFTLHEELKKAAAADDVRNALAAKISKERIGTEVLSFFLCSFFIGWSEKHIFNEKYPCISLGESLGSLGFIVHRMGS